MLWKPEDGPVVSGNLEATPGAGGLLTFTRVSDGKVLLRDLWILDPLGDGRWRRPDCSGVRPAARMGHSLEYLAHRGALASFGGFVKGVKGGYSTQVTRCSLCEVALLEPQDGRCLV